MSKVFFISDLHIGHKNIVKFAQGHRYGPTMEEHDHWLIEQWNSVVSKQDTVHVLGDVCFDKEKMPLFKQMNGNKVILLGNHDKFSITEYQKYFSKIEWFGKYKGYWLSHAPIHPNSLRDLYNIHGHVHQRSLDDRRYINVCVEPLYGIPICFDEIVEKYN